MDEPKLWCDTLKKVWEVVHSALPAKFLVDTHASLLTVEGVTLFQPKGRWQRALSVS